MKLTLAIATSSLAAVIACGTGRGDDDKVITPDASLPGADGAIVDGGSADADLVACAYATTGAPWVAFASNRNGNYDIYRIRADGTCSTQVTTYPTDDLSPAWRPGDDVLAFSGERGGTLSVYTRDLGASDDVRLDVGSLQAAAPAWSPDGAWLAFEGRVAGELETSVYKIAFAGGAPVRLTQSGANDSGPLWSLDGETIYFVSNRAGGYEIYSMSADGDGEAPLTTGSGILGKPSLSGDGLTIAYARSNVTTTDPEIVIHTIAGSAEHVLTSEHDSEPAFDPAGAAIAVSSYRYGGPEIVILNSDTGAVIKRLTDDDTSDGAPAYAEPGA